MIVGLIFSMVVLMNSVQFVLSDPIKVNDLEQDISLESNEATEVQTNVISPRVIGGMYVWPNYIPYVVALNITFGSRATLCGGSLITANHVLTAAHCVYGNPTVIRVSFGARALRSPLYVINVRPLENGARIFIHPSYFQSPILVQTNDIAIIKLPYSASLIRAMVFPIGLIDRTRTNQTLYNGTLGMISGWGRTQEQGTPSPDLKHANTTIISSTQCRQRFQYVSEVHICSITSSFGTGPCNGDSGGPLVIRDGDSYRQIGITSFVANTCSTGPSIYTYIGLYLNWIYQMIRL